MIVGWRVTDEGVPSFLLSHPQMDSFEVIWQRIESYAGKKFTQIQGGEFTYEVIRGHVVPNRTNQQLPKSQFEEAFRLVPLENTIPLQHLRGPSYIFAILMDNRIRVSDW